MRATARVHDMASSHLGNDRESSAELFASSLIGKVDSAGILRLLQLLPSEAPSRGSREVGHGSEFSFTTGAYTYDHGKRHGLRQNCRDFPLATQVLNEYMSTYGLGHPTLGTQRLPCSGTWKPRCMLITAMIPISLIP